eukprot:maker-scaffold_4-snap-gene-2.45-mRNA-1 protein AED:0.02 eAED:0.02 QI:33/1/1/1/1/1/3/23/295
MMKKHKDLLVVSLTYILSFIGSLRFSHWFVGDNMDSLMILSVLLDLVWTFLIWLSAVWFNNSSLYDPYWSVAPVAIILLWVVKIKAALDIESLTIITAVLTWSVRLTTNWARDWSGLDQEDFRYIELHKQFPHPLIYWPFISLGGIMLMPTTLVFLGCTPIYYSLISEQTATSFSLIIPLLTCIVAAVIQYFADEQMRTFRTKNTKDKKIFEGGLWKYSRHPNYFREILFWFGVWSFSLLKDINLYFAGLGFLAMVLLFIFISVPLMEKKILNTRPEYKLVQERVSMLVPLPPKA